VLSATLQIVDHLRCRTLHAGPDFDGDKQSHTWSILLTMSSAACEA
jgi:hypothetical protein